MADGSVLVVGGTGGLGREVARRYRDRGAVVVITGRDADRSAAIAAELGAGVMLENRAVNGVNLYVDGGWVLM